MNLKNFEETIDDTILERGRQYYKSGHVETLEFDGSEWIAEVTGSDDYTVTVTLDEAGSILDSECDCPYDWGEYCKHQAAVFFALRNEAKKPEKQAKAKKQKQDLESLLSGQAQSVLVSVLMEYAARDKLVRDDLLFRFSPKQDKVAYAKKLIQNSIKRVSRRDFVDYGDVYDAIQGAEKALRIAEGETGDALSCVSICIVILREMMDLLSYCDDSDGNVGGIISETIELLNTCTDELPEEAKNTDKLFDLIFTHASEKIYDGWTDWRFDILRACVSLCREPGLRKKLEDHLWMMEGSRTDGGFRSRYDTSEIQNLCCHIIERYDGDAAAERYKEQNLNNSDFRKDVIQKAIHRGLLDRALQLCVDGENADAGYAGLVAGWRHMRYDVYERLGNTTEQKKLAAEFVLSGEFLYYEKLKTLYNPEEWTAVLQGLLRELDDGRYRRDIYVQILIHENLKLRLLEYCKKNISSVTRLHPHLLPECKADLDSIFIKHITQEAEKASNRSHYRAVCDILKHYKKACGAKNAAEIKNELLVKYPRRPAFVDELRKLKL